MFVRMVLLSRRYIRSTYSRLCKHCNELNDILLSETGNRRDELVNWFLRFYVFVVQTNMVINAAIATSMGSCYKRSITAYAKLSGDNSIHRVKYETDPASPRAKGAVEDFTPPVGTGIDTLIDYLGLPGNAGYYMEIREWFRDSYTRLYHKLHFGLLPYETISPYWFDSHPDPRQNKGGFWQDNNDADSRAEALVIYPGRVEGRVGTEILVVDSLDPGHYRVYQTFKAVIARLGGRLSHGAILLRELQIPSAIIPQLPLISDGTVICLNNDSISIRSRLSGASPFSDVSPINTIVRD